MSEPKTALDLERLMHEAAMNRNRAMNTDEETAEFERIRAEMAARLDATPADAPEQIDLYRLQRAPVIEQRDKAHKQIADLTAERDEWKMRAESCAGVGAWGTEPDAVRGEVKK